jgi:putative membrane protein
MSYITGHWSFDPFLTVAIVVVIWHEIGLWQLAQRSRPDRTRERRRRSWWFYAGLGVMLLAVQSPVDYWADYYFFAHMLQHLLLMFAAPSLIVAGAPWQPLLDALPGRSGQSVTRGVLAGEWSRPVRLAGGLLLRPWVAIGLFNFIMIFWHLPGPYDVGSGNSAVHIWLMHGSYFAAGILFWLQYIPSPPFRRRMPLISQAAGLLGTNLVMIALAMALSIFTTHSVYAVYDHVPGVTLPPFADQQIGAAILWVCGDFWAVPTMIVIVRQLVETEGSVGVALERILHRGSASAQADWSSASRGRTKPAASMGWTSRGRTMDELRGQRSAPPDAGR